MKIIIYISLAKRLTGADCRSIPEEKALLTKP